ncbi:MAG TPA: hypothetical protein VGQ76_15950 [Thermoanaerobaculia bacterium]|jgi:hypothetical protein|nr:hypothetical protein [Thermoanaerobaculia bacterium]
MRHLLRIAIALCFTIGAAADGPGLSLRITDEAAPAGSIVQIKIDVTEPKPISTGRGKIKIKGVTTVEGIVLMNKGQDTYGVAMLDGEDLSFAITSPSSRFGTPADYPILGIAGTVATAPLGTTFPLTLDPAGLGFRDPSGTVYPTEIRNGNLRIANAVTIGDVSPGSSIVPAGGVVQISGANFKPSTRIRLSETNIAEQRFISSQRIDVVLAQTTNMHGLRIRARNDDGDDKTESEYFSYERTTAESSSNDPILKKVVPLFAPTTYTLTMVQLPARVAQGRRRAVRSGSGSIGGVTLGNTTNVGVALQNLSSSTATVSIELIDRFGYPYAVTTMSVGPDRYLVRELSEMFGSVALPSAFGVRSNVPIQILGLVADRSAGIAAAVPPG